MAEDRPDRQFADHLFLGAVVIPLVVAAFVFLAFGANRAGNTTKRSVDVVRPSSVQVAPLTTVVTQSSPVEAGRQLFMSGCSPCHGKDARGGIGKNLVASQFLRGLNDEQVAAFLKVGRGVGDPANTTGIAMPPRGGNPTLTDDQLRALAAYLRSIAE